jgi:hypothetical protein
MSEDKYEHIHRSRKHIFLNNFLGGMAWGLGASVGISVLLAILGFIASQVNIIPVFGTFISNIIDFILQHNQLLRR